MYAGLYSGFSGELMWASAGFSDRASSHVSVFWIHEHHNWRSAAAQKNQQCRQSESNADHFVPFNTNRMIQYSGSLKISRAWIKNSDHSSNPRWSRLHDRSTREIGAVNESRVLAGEARVTCDSGFRVDSPTHLCKLMKSHTPP